MQANKEFYVVIKGEKVVVTEEVYRAYVRPIRKEQRRKRRTWKCQVKGKKGNLVRCKKDCSKCEFALSGHNATGNVLSLDVFIEDGVEILDRDFDLERMYIEKEDGTSCRAEIWKAISELTPRQQEMVKMIYFEGKSQEEICQILGLTKGTVSLNLKRALANLREILQK